MSAINNEHDSKINVNQYILVDNVLYEIGLSFISVRDGQWKRKLIFSPKIIFLFHLWYLFVKIVCIFVNNSNTLSLLIMGDIGHYFQFKNIWNILLILFSTMIISSRFVNYYNYTHGIELTFRLFKVLSGLHSIISIGIDNNNHDIQSRTSSSSTIRKLIIL